MINTQYAYFKKINILLDALTVIISFYSAYFIRQNFFHLPLLGDFLYYSWIVVIAIALWNIIFYVNGLYPTRRIRRMRQVIWIIIRCELIGIVSLIFILYLLKVPHLSRPLIVGFGVLNTFFMGIKELAVRKYFRRLRKQKKNLRNAVIIGNNQQVEKLFHIVNKDDYLGVNLLGYMFVDSEQKHENSHLKCLGNAKEIDCILHEKAVDIVIVGLSKERISDIEEPLYICEEEGIEVWLSTDIFHLIIAKTSVDELGGVPFLVFKTTPELLGQLFIKRFVDIAVSASLLVLLLPFFIIVFFLIKFTSPGPAIFKQKRATLRGRKFIMFKFRSMMSDAEQRKTELQKLNIMDGPVFKIKSDPRVTKIGRFLRKTSIDELPQLWNVLVGDMSLVGPRPPLPSEVVEYKGWHRRRLSMRSGITCLWQISGRNEIINFDKWTQLDLKYIDNWSLWLDFQILLKTIPAVLAGSGAK